MENIPQKKKNHKKKNFKKLELLIFKNNNIFKKKNLIIKINTHVTSMTHKFRHNLDDLGTKYCNLYN